MGNSFQKWREGDRLVPVGMRCPVRMAVAIAMAVGVFGAQLGLARGDNRMDSAAGLPQAPDTGTPEGHTQPGTRRPEAACAETEVPLTAVVANNGRDFTISEYPTFLFYVPFESKKIEYMEFVLLDEGERQTIYRTAVELEGEPGIVKVTVPEGPDRALAEGDNYRWYFKLDCLPDRSEAPDLVVDGWVRYVGGDGLALGGTGEGSVGDYRTYAECEYWYDAISALAGLHFGGTGDGELAEDWSGLLESLGHGSLVGMPMVESRLLPAEE